MWMCKQNCMLYMIYHTREVIECIEVFLVNWRKKCKIQLCAIYRKHCTHYYIDMHLLSYQWLWALYFLTIRLMWFHMSDLCYCDCRVGEQIILLTVICEFIKIMSRDSHGVSEGVMHVQLLVVWNFSHTKKNICRRNKAFLPVISYLNF